MSAPTTLTTPRLCLRPLTLGDAPTIERLAGRREVAAMTRSIPHPLSLAQAHEWLAQRLAEGAEGKGAAFGVVRASAADLIGAIGVQVDAEHRSAELGFWIGVECWGQGYATEAACAVVRYGFEALGLNRIQAHHLTKNPASGRVLEKAGLRREGLLRQAIRKWEVFEDVVIYAILRQDWNPQALPREQPRALTLGSRTHG